MKGPAVTVSRGPVSLDAPAGLSSLSGELPNLRWHIIVQHGKFLSCLLNLEGFKALAITANSDILTVIFGVENYAHWS